ncbi:MAG: hypothetical protein ACRESZ_16140 [Methylococcales bacterium]
MNIWKWFWVVGILLVFALPVRSDETPTSPLKDLSLEAGRSFGHTLGDLIRHEIRFRADKPYRLEKASLPRPGLSDKWLELRKIEVTEFEEEHTRLYRIEVIYQIFPSVRESETLAIPGLALRIFSGDQSLTFDTPRTTLTSAPLIPAWITDAEVTIRPAIEAATVPLTVHSRNLAILCPTFAIVLGCLAWRRTLFPFMRSGTSPFASALGEVRQCRNAEPKSPEYRNALLAIHRAFNDIAGETLFASGLEGFFHKHPAFEAMRAKTGIFFALSRQVFFTRSACLGSTDYPVQWLEQLCRDYQKIERNRQ